MKPARKVYIVGAAHTPFIGKFHPDFIWKKHPDFGKKENPDLEDYVHRAALAALEDAGVAPKDVQKGFVGNFVGELFNNQGHLGAVLAAAHPDLYGKAFARLEGACASGALALLCGVDAIAAGADTVLVVGAEMQTTQNAKVGADYLARAAHYKTQRDIDPFTFPALFARRTKAYLEAFPDMGLGDLAKVVANAYGNANKNPLAHMHTVKISAEQASEASDSNPCFLQAPDLKPFLKVTDCSQVSDGGSGLVLVSEDGLKRLGKSPADAVELVAYGHAVGPITGPSDLTEMDVTRLAGQQAFESAGLAPADVQVGEVHDCFVIAEVLALEALGFAPKGGAKALIDEGALWIDGRLPVNTGGGLMAFGHPVGATGVKQAGEIYRQLTGRCGDYQVPGQPQVGLAQNMGGDDRTSVVTLYRRG